MKFIVNKEKTISKKDSTIIKCENCGFKYYDGDVHVCGGKSVEEKIEEKPKERKVPIKIQKESFKIWEDN